MAGHEVSPECAKRFEAVEVRQERSREDERDRLNELREIRQLIVDTREELLTSVATLKERSRSWGVIGGLLSGGAVSILAGLVLAALL